MEKKFFYRLLFAQLMVIVIVVLLFSALPPKTAGLVAAAFFFILSIGTLITTWPAERRGLATLTSFAFLIGAIIPILTIRFLNWESDFKTTELFGIPGPEFHRISGYLYLAMVVGTVIDRIRTWKIKKAA